MLEGNNHALAYKQTQYAHSACPEVTAVTWATRSANADISKMSTACSTGAGFCSYWWCQEEDTMSTNIGTETIHRQRDSYTIPEGFTATNCTNVYVAPLVGSSSSITLLMFSFSKTLDSNSTTNTTVDTVVPLLNVEVVSRDVML